MKESDIQSSIIDYLSVLERQGKIFFHRANNTAIYDPVGKRFRSLAKGQKKGFPDILVLKAGRCVALEVKTITGKQSKEQREIQNHFEQQGFEYYVVRNIEEVQRIMEIE